MTGTFKRKLYSQRTMACVAAAALLTLTACGGGGGDGSSEDGNGAGANPPSPGTNPPASSGVSVRGTTSSERQFATTEVTARAQSGEITTATFNEQGQFTFDDLLGTGPWILRSDLGNQNFLYSIAGTSGISSFVQNIHSYTDAIARNWYATQGVDIDAIFNSVGALADVPTTAELFAIQEELNSVVTDVQAAYNLQNTDLNSIEYVANGAGVDEYLTENPILQDGGNITIIIFDPSTNTQSVAASNLDLSTNLTVADTTSPDAPQAVRAIPSATDEITLVWDVASDNVGIARYSILRDGAEIDTSPFPVYVDGGLAADTDFTYTIVAIDGAGNESPESTAVSSQALAALDTTPPTAPGALSISAGTGSLDIGWTQTGINDVASFAIRRGLNETTLMDVGNVTSTFYFDTAVDAGIEYCYDVRAVDGSGNLSAATPVTCETALGTVVTTTQPVPPVTETPPGASSNLTAPLVDVTNLACTEELPSRMDEDTTLAAGCYLALSGLTVSSPNNLTLMPGVVIKFGANTDLTVFSGASFTAEGTPANPIVLTAREPGVGAWQGIEISFSNSPNNILDHVQLEFAGGTTDQESALTVFADSTRPARIAVSNSTFRMNDGPSLFIPSFAPLSSLNGNRYVDNEVSVRVTPESAALLDARSSYVGNQTDAIEVVNSLIDAETTWKNLGIPYHSKGMSVDELFTIEAGTTVLFDEGASVETRGDGALILPGTMANPILLSSISGQPGRWGGLAFTFSQIESQLSYVTIDGASSESTIRPGAVATAADSNRPTRLALNNVTIQNSTDFGLFADAFTEFGDFTNVTLTGNARLATMSIEGAQVFNNPGAFTGNTEDVIVISNRSVNGPRTFSNPDVIYSIGGLSVNDELILGAGVTFSMQAGADFRVGQGSLTALGTAAQPISIVGERRLPGFWNGIEFSFSASALNQFDNVLVADGGDGGGGIAQAANIRFRCTTTSPSRLSIANSRIENSAGVGIFIDSSGCVVNVDANTTFTGNANGDTN